MALTLDPQSQNYGDVNAAPSISVAIKESDNLNIKGEAKIIDGEGTTVKTENWEATGKYTYSPNFADKWESMADGASSVQLTVKSYEPIPEEPIYADKNHLYLEQDTFTYDGTTKIPVLHGYDSTKMRLFGNTSAIAPGNYTLRVRLLDGYYWVNPQGGGNQYSDLTFSWSITKGQGYITINRTTVRDGGSYTVLLSDIGKDHYYTVSSPGGNVSLQSNPYSSTIGVRFNAYSSMILMANKNGSGYFYITAPASANTSATTVTVYFAINAIQTINRLPEQSNILYYNGDYQYATWNYYDSNQLSCYGDQGLLAGNYTAYFTPKSGYQWYDGTTDSKAVQWVINDAYTPPTPVYSNPVSISPSSVTVSWRNDVYAYVTLKNETSQTIRVRATGQTGYGPFGTFDLSATRGSWYNDTVDLSYFDSVTLKILAGSNPELFRNIGCNPNSMTITIDYWDPDQGYDRGKIGSDTIYVNIES